MTSGGKYLILCLAATAVLVGAMGMFNYVADPCGIYHAGKKWDWIRCRPELLDTSFVWKAHETETTGADVLLLGSSRTAEGLDPTNPVIPGHGYNLGLPDSSMYEQWRYLQHAAAAHMPGTVVLGLDMDGFPAARPNDPIFSEDRLLVRPDGRPTPFLSRELVDAGPTLFSLSMARLSLTTLRAQHGLPLRFEQGFAANAPMANHLDLASSVYLANKKWVLNVETVRFRDAAGHAPQMDAFDKLVGFCADHHIHLIVFLQPLHSMLLDRFTTDWSGYSDWVKTAVAHMESHPGLNGQFWDFTSYNSMSTESFPAPTDKYSHMRYYWEGSHYRKIVGDTVLQRIFTGAGPASFGRQITSATVGDDLQRLADEQSAWHDRHQAVQVDVAAPAVTGL